MSKQKKKRIQNKVSEEIDEVEEERSELAKDLVDQVKKELEGKVETTIEMPVEESEIVDKLTIEEPEPEEIEEMPTELPVSAPDFQFPSGFEIVRNHNVPFEQFNFEFITVVYVNTLRCTADKATDFKDFLNNILESDFKKIILDVSSSEFIDSTFLGVMVSMLKKLRKDDREMTVVVDLSKMTTTTFLLSGLDRVFNIVETVEIAFNSFYNK